MHEGKVRVCKSSLLLLGCVREGYVGRGGTLSFHSRQQQPAAGEKGGTEQLLPATTSGFTSAQESGQRSLSHAIGGGGGGKERAGADCGGRRRLLIHGPLLVSSGGVGVDVNPEEGRISPSISQQQSLPLLGFCRFILPSSFSLLRGLCSRRQKQENRVIDPQLLLLLPFPQQLSQSEYRQRRRSEQHNG